MDRDLFDFADLRATGVADAGGDVAFDDEGCADEPTSGSSAITLHPRADLARAQD